MRGAIAFLLYVEDFVVGFHEGFIGPTCKVEGYVWKVNCFLVGFDGDFEAICFENLADFIFVFSICLGIALHTTIHRHCRGRLGL